MIVDISASSYMYNTSPLLSEEFSNVEEEVMFPVDFSFDKIVEKFREKYPAKKR